MKRFTLFVLLLSIITSIYSQELSVRKDRNNLPKEQKTEAKSQAIQEVTPSSPAFKAGSYLQQSATFQYVAVSGGIIAGGLAIAGTSQNNDGLKNTAYIFGAMAVITEIFSIHLKLKAGKELKL